jgi:hypothetical protein
MKRYISHTHLTAASLKQATLMSHPTYYCRYSTLCGFNSAADAKINQDSLLVAERLGGFEQ